MFFLLGHLARRLWEHSPISPAGSFALLAGAAFCSCLESPISVDRPWSYLSCLCFAGSLPGIFAATKNNRFLNYLGDLTYPVYLVHTAVISAVFWPWSYFADVAHWIIDAGSGLPSLPADSVFILLFTVGAVIAAAVVMRHVVEKPLNDVLKGGFALTALSDKSRNVNSSRDGRVVEVPVRINEGDCWGGDGVSNWK
jgi:peptidoglycan/LPS O-acetylase OafA/YrhL